MHGERKLVLRWIHLALVNTGNPDELASVIRPVEQPAYWNDVNNGASDPKKDDKQD